MKVTHQRGMFLSNALVVVVNQKAVSPAVVSDYRKILLKSRDNLFERLLIYFALCLISIEMRLVDAFGKQSRKIPTRNRVGYRV